VYSPENVGHFGLAYDAYTHFTSPIRRYPDLLVHRAIKAVLSGERYVPAQDAGDWEAIGMHCSMTERRADEADRDVENWLKCYYMQDRIGEEFDGSVSAVVPFGLFVALDDVFVEGLVHISDLGNDYFHYDDAHHSLVGERTGERYRLSDRVRVQLVRVNMEASKIDFRIVTGPARATERVGKTAKDQAARASAPAAVETPARRRRGKTEAERADVPALEPTEVPAAKAKPAARKAPAQPVEQPVERPATKPAVKPKAAKPKASPSAKPAKAASKTAKPRKSATGAAKKKAKRV
jgi:ribonuclease R